MGFELRKAHVAKFDNRLKDSYVTHYTIDETSIEHPICLYDNLEQAVVDIDNGAYYEVLKRDVNRRIDPSEIKRIKLNHAYVLETEKINWSEYSYSQKIIMLLKYYKILANIRLSLVDYSDKNKKWQEREDYEVRHNYSEENQQKVKKISDFKKK